jgi:hypothetical protein
MVIQFISNDTDYFWVKTARTLKRRPRTQLVPDIYFHLIEMKRGALLTIVTLFAFRIQNLSLRNCYINDQGANHIGRALATNKHLQTLNLCFNKVSCEGVASIAKVLN